MFQQIPHNPKLAWRCSNKHLLPWDYPKSACPRCGLELFRLHAPAWMQHDKQYRPLWEQLLADAEDYHRHEPDASPHRLLLAHDDGPLVVVLAPEDAGE